VYTDYKTMQAGFSLKKTSLCMVYTAVYTLNNSTSCQHSVRSILMTSYFCASLWQHSCCSCIHHLLNTLFAKA